MDKLLCDNLTFVGQVLCGKDQAGRAIIMQLIRGNRTGWQIWASVIKVAAVIGVAGVFSALGPVWAQDTSLSKQEGRLPAGENAAAVAAETAGESVKNSDKPAVSKDRGTRSNTAKKISDSSVSSQSQQADSSQNLADDIVVIINGSPVSRTQFELAESELGAELAGLPRAERQSVVLEYLVETMLMADAAKRHGLDQDAKYKERLAYYRRRALRDMFFERKIRDSVTEAQARAIYDRQIGPIAAKDEVRVRHILVETKAEAEKILAELEQGRNFGALAQQYSLGPSRVQGGDLGYFTRGQMVEAFENAAFALEVGEVSKPVKTQFGWHVLRVEDKRSSEVPSFETVKNRIRAPLIQQRARAVLRALKKDAKIEILDKQLKSEIEQARTDPIGDPG